LRIPFIEEKFDTPTPVLLQPLAERADPILVDRGMGQENVALFSGCGGNVSIVPAGSGVFAARFQTTTYLQK